MERRRYLALTGLAVSGTLAGCGGGGDDSESPTDDGDTNDTSGDDSAGEDGTNGRTDDASSDGSTADGTENDNPLEVRGLLVPESADVGGEIEIRGQVSNNGDEVAVYTETVYVGFSDYGEPTEWEEIPVETPVQPGDAVQWSLDPLEVERPTRVFVRLGDDGPQKVVEVPPERAPYIRASAAVSGWEEPGDLEGAAIEQAPAGSTVELAFRYWFYSENQQRDAVIRINIFGPDGNLVGNVTQPIPRDVENNGWEEWEGTLPVTTEGAEPGEYSFELFVIDRQSSVESAPSYVDIELVDEQNSE